MKKSTKWLLGVTASVLILAASLNVFAVVMAPPEAPVPRIESWDRFVDGLRALVPQILSKLPKSMQDDPQIRQEVARLTLESLAAMVIKAVSSDGDHPVFLPWGNITLNIGQPNADTTYRLAVITPGGMYRMRGIKGSVRIAKIAQFAERPDAVPGQAWIDTIGYDDLNALHADTLGRFDVILSPERPKSYQGDWWKLDPRTTTLMIRMVSDDWTKERDPTIAIERMDGPATRPRPSKAQMEAHLNAIVKDTAEMVLLLVDHVPKVRSAGYVNKLKVLEQVSGQLTGQFYYDGDYDLNDGEALIVEAKVPEHCLYYSIILTNEVYETTDWYNNHSSLNDSQLHIDKDGVMRVVVSAKDPGVANWLDTAGYPRGAVQGRWTECTSQPIPTVKKVAFADVREQLPQDTPLVSAMERDAIIRERRAHLQQRPLW
jgi:hypothetical protein